MQNIDRPTFCQPCQKPTPHQIRYRSDPDFVGRVLTCESCGQRKLEPLGPGTCCQFQSSFFANLRDFTSNFSKVALLLHASKTRRPNTPTPSQSLEKAKFRL